MRAVYWHTLELDPPSIDDDQTSGNDAHTCDQTYGYERVTFDLPGVDKPSVFNSVASRGRVQPAPTLRTLPKPLVIAAALCHRLPQAQVLGFPLE